MLNALVVMCTDSTIERSWIAPSTLTWKGTLVYTTKISKHYLMESGFLVWTNQWAWSCFDHKKVSNKQISKLYKLIFAEWKYLNIILTHDK